MALEFVLKLQDLLTPRLGQSVRMADSALARMQTEANRAGRQMGNSVDGVRRKIEELRTVAGRTTDWKIFREATREAQRLEEQITSLQNRASGRSSLTSGIGGMIGGAAVAYGAYAGVKNSLELAAEREKQKTNLSVMTGSPAMGNALFGQIQKMADVTPFETRDLLGSAQMLMQYGLSVKNLMPTLQQLGDISGADKEKMQSLTMAFGKVVSEGKLNGRALEEFIYAGFNPLNYMAEKSHKSMAELRKEMEKGAITTKMVEEAMNAATGPGGRFYNLMNKQAETLGGKWSTVMDNVHHQMADFGEMLAPAAKGLMDLTLKFFNLGKASELQDFQNETTHLKALRNEIGLTNTTNERRKQIFDELKANYPDLVANIKDEKDALDKLAPTLDAYLNKRYIATGQLRIKSRYADDLEGMQDALKRGDDIHGSAIVYAEHLASKFGITTDGMSSGMAMIKVQNALANAVKTGRDHQIYHPGVGLDDGGMISDEGSGLAQLRKLIKDNKDAQEDLNKHLPGAKLAAKALDNFNKVMGITAPGATPKTTPGTSAIDDLKSSTGDTLSKQREITINIKSFIENFKLESINVKEGLPELEKMMKEMFLRIVNSANGLAPN